MSIEKNNISAWILDKKKLLSELAEDIARKFWIDKNQAETLIKKDTLNSLKSLTEELTSKENNDKKLNEKELEKLFFTLRWALEVIENSSKIEIKTLKDDVEKSIDIENFKNKIEDYLPAELIKKAKNPQNLHEHILWFSLWSANSIIATVDALYQIGVWIIKAPYDLYLVITWKAEFKKIKDWTAP